MKTYKEILEDAYASDFKVKKFMGPDGKWQERKLRPHRVEFKNSKMRGEPAQDDDRGDVGMKEETVPYWKKSSWIKKMSQAAKQERLAREKKEAEQKKTVKEETDTKQEHDLGYAHASQGKKSNPYNPGSASHAAYEAGHEAHKRHFGESTDTHELGIDHDEPISRHEHIKAVIAKHGGKVSGSSDKSTYVQFPADKVHAAKAELKAGRVHADHWVNGEIKEEFMQEQAPVAPSIGVHRIAVTVSEPDHPAVSKRDETHQKFVRVTAHDKDKAIEQGKKHFKKKGFKVHSGEHVGMVYEEVALDENDHDPYYRAQENKKSAEAAKKQGDNLAYHLHMADHHDDMAHWSQLRGRHNVSDQHLNKAEQHADEAQKLRKKEKLGEEVTKVDEVLNPSMGAGEYIKDFQKSDAPQFKGKSQEKRRMMGIAAYMAAKKQVKEETQLDEANHREFASQGKMHPDMAKHMAVGQEMDYYEPKTGDKVSGKVMHKSATEVHMKQTHDSYDPKKKGTVHKFSIASKLDEASCKDDVPFDGPYTKKPGTVKDKSGAVHTPMSRARDLARQAMKKQMKEEEGIDLSDEQADELMLEALTGAQHKIDKNKNGKVDSHDFKILRGEVCPECGKSPCECGTVKESGEIEARSLSFGQFMSQLNEYTPGPGGITRVQGRSYGAQYHDPEGDDDADDKKKQVAKSEPAVKRGRGRPAGSKSGANQKVTTGRKGSGVDYTGYKLHLPNSNR